MAYQPIRAQKQTVQTSEASDSGSKWGSVLGALAAGAATVASGGAALPVVLGAAGAGASLGGLAGGAIGNSAAEFGTRNVNQAVQTGQAGESDSTAIARRAAQKGQSELSALIQAENALSKVPPEVAKEYEEPIKQARAMAQQKYGVA